MEMTQEEKQLLLQDLCARLPYGVKIWYKYYPDKITEKFATSIRLADRKIALSSKFNKEGNWHPIEEANEILIKPYLRPMSSMNEKEKKEYEATCVDRYETLATYDWLNENHFDYRGLIEKGLAIEAPEGMYT